MYNIKTGPLPDANGSGSQTQILTQPKSIIQAGKARRNREWYPPPEPGQSAADVRVRGNPARRWHKADGYQRVKTWEQLTANQQMEYARWFGHTRQSWNGGYIRVTDISAARIGDRFAC